MQACLSFVNVRRVKLRPFLSCCLIVLALVSAAFATDEVRAQVDSVPVPAASSQESAQGGTAPEAGFGEMTPERRAQAIEYSDTRNRIFFIHTFYSFGVLLLLLFSGWSAKIQAWAQRRVARPIGTWLLYFLVVSGLLLILDLPFSYYTGYALEHRYGHSNQSFGAWLLELIKGEAIGYVVGALIIHQVYRAIRRKGTRWWLWVGGMTAPVAAFLIVLAPVLISPLFNTFSPLSNERLRDKILALAAQAGIPDSRVFEVDASKQSNKYNAYVTGLFGTQRIVLYDTILKDMNDDEILFIMAHEIGHYTMKHIWLGVAGVSAFVMAAAWLIHRLAGGMIRRFGRRWGFSSLGEFASFPLLGLLLSVMSFLFMPASNALSRHFEHRADAYGLDLTQNREAAAKAFEKLAAKNLSNPDPAPFIEFWLYDHPTIQDRVEYVLGKGDH